jgi:hypothetical protein
LVVERSCGEERCKQDEEEEEEEDVKALAIVA